jgi:YidC/Oxa1 family membrane protein insertase
MPDSPAGDERKELSMEMRLLLAFLLMGAVLFLTPYFYSPSPPPEKAEPETAEQRAPAQEAVTAEPEAPPPLREMPGQVSAASEETFTVETDVYKIVFSNRGAVVRSWILKEYVDSGGDPLELVNLPAVETVGCPFSLEFPEKAPALDANTALFSAKRTRDSLGIDFELSDGTVYYRKSFRFEQDSYLSQVSTEVLREGRAVPHLLAWRGGFGDATVPKARSMQHSLFFDVSENKLVVNDADEAEDGPVTNRGNYSFAGIEDAYFAAVALPGNGSSFQIRTFSDPVVTEQDEKAQPHVGAAFGGDGKNEFPFFVGPKDLELLKEIDPRLQQIVDFGWFSFLAKPLFLTLSWLNNNWVHNYGWSIVLLTVAINFILLPLKFTSLKSMRKMQLLQPQIKAINDKYKGIGMRDARKQEQNQEVRALYKKHGVNPLGGCMPMVLQIPFFFAFFKVLTVTIEIRGAEWLWVNDLSQPETLPIRILPVAMIVSQFLMQKMSPSTSPDPNQPRVMMLMPLFMGFIFYGFSSGLVLYWLTSNVVGVAQQLFFNKAFHTPAPEPAPAVVKSKSSSKRKKRQLRK